MKELGDAGECPGKSCLFFLKAYRPGIRLLGDRAKWLEKNLASWGARCASDGPGKTGGKVYILVWPYSSPHKVSKVNSIWSIEKCR